MPSAWSNQYGAGITILHVLTDVPMESCVFNMIGSTAKRVVRKSAIPIVVVRLP